jgi:hypothetical protein
MTEAMMLAQGFTVQHMVDLVRTGLATATAKRIRAGHREIEVARMRDHARAAATDQRGTGSSLIATSARSLPYGSGEFDPDPIHDGKVELGDDAGARFTY